jgi:hypothetical protein
MSKIRPRSANEGQGAIAKGLGIQKELGTGGLCRGGAEERAPNLFSQWK